jgi:hypothetical protein
VADGLDRTFDESLVGKFDPQEYDWSRAGATEHGLRPVAGRQTLRSAGEVLDRIEMAPGAEIAVTAGALDAGVSNSLLHSKIRAYQGLPARALVTQSTSYAPVTGQAVMVQNSRITSQGDGINPTGGKDGPTSLVEYSCIERDGTRVADAHHDGIQIWQGGNAVIRRNWISGWNTSAIMLKSDRELNDGDGPVSHVRIEQNYLANPAGHFILYVRDGGKGRPQYVTIVDNVLGPGSPISSGRSPKDRATFVRTEAERDAAVLAGDESAVEWIVWSGNTDAETGLEITPPGGWRLEQ